MESNGLLAHSTGVRPSAGEAERPLEQPGLTSVLAGPEHQDRAEVAAAPGRATGPGGRVAERRTKKGKRKAAASGQPPPLGPEDYVRVTPVPKRTEQKENGSAFAKVLHEGWRPVSLSELDKAPQIEIDKATQTATSRKGYRMVRATHGACEGTWYYEITIKHLGESGHVRLGWSTRKGELQAPVGYDDFSFAYRDIEGVKVHQALREDYGAAFGEGDVIGCFLHLGQGGRPFEKERSDIVAWKGNLYFREDPDAEAPKPLAGSFVAFTHNGNSQGVAYRDVLEGTYYPAVSLYTLPTQLEGASVSVNLGAPRPAPKTRSAVQPEPLAQGADGMVSAGPDFRYAQPNFEGCLAARAVSTLAGDPPQEPAAAATSPAKGLAQDRRHEDAMDVDPVTLPGHPNPS